VLQGREEEVEQHFPELIPMIIGTLAGLLLGLGIAWFVQRTRVNWARRETSEGQIEIARLNERVSRLEAELSEAKRKRDELQADQVQLNAKIAELTATLNGERTQSGEKLSLLNDAKGEFSTTFELLANRILEEKGERFAEQSRTSLDQLLSPLRTRLEAFQNKVEEVYVQEGKDRAALGNEVQRLRELNQQLSQDAHNLTLALKGSSKTQGTWGELILERVLEASGLRKGDEYELRETYKRDDGRRAQPDVVIHLPEDKHLVVDAKVSLTAYAEYMSSDSDLARDAAVERHLDSVRRHVKELSEKNYQELYALKSLDFVIMFVPVEPAFILAIAQDTKLCEGAWKKNVLLVSPSTFLFVVRTVAHLWRQEQQNRNVQEIARRGADFYDKLVGFVKDLTGIGESLKQATNSYDSACSKLSTGRGNLIQKAETLRDLGVKPSKSLPQEFLQLDLDETFIIPSLAAADEAAAAREETQTDNAEVNTEEDIPF
jgi:DNA recombination protein RmuC